ncbi:MAG: hypothetical protein AAGC60_09790 [Acidobacteriota bacterium]
MTPVSAHSTFRRPRAAGFGVGLALALWLGAASGVPAQTPPCNPCAGVRVDDPSTLTEALGAEPRLEGEARLYVLWPTRLGDVDAVGEDDVSTPSVGAFDEVRQAGGTPWTVTVFESPAPLLENLEIFEAELRALASVARGAGERAHLQIDWRPAVGEVTVQELGFLVKRAAVAITGAHPQARVIVGPLEPDADALRALYGEDIAAYADGIALRGDAPLTDLEAARDALAELDPGKPIVLDHLPWPDQPSRALARAAEMTEKGFAVTVFGVPAEVASSEALAAELAPLKVLAREFQGDLSFDPYTTPRSTTGARAWTFVRGEDLSLRVIAESPQGADALQLGFDDTLLRGPRRIALDDGFESMVLDQTRGQDGLALRVDEPSPVTLLKLGRVTAAELEGGIEDEVDVAGERQIPVEEILRRLQAFEDRQARRLDHYTATNTLSLRFRLGDGAETVEATFEGPFFYRRGEGFDWAWETLYVNGVKWRGETLPEIPLIQPEKAAVLPLEINFTQEYAYRLRGTEVVDGRDAWVIDFEPVAADSEGNLYQGTVWVDRSLYARLKTRALQVGLEGEVISNEETMTFEPVDSAGQPTEWSSDAYVLPVRNVGQQILSILNASTQVERETRLSSIEINVDGFERRRQAALDSEVTMVRDTEDGLRYLVKNEDGERVVQEERDTTRLFALGGVFYDESLDYPIPLAGVNYLALDWRGTGQQVNIFFAGALLTANWAQPRIFDSRWDFGASAFGFFIPTSDEQYRDGREIEAEEIESSRGRVSVFLGRPLGSFTKLDFTYSLGYTRYSDADDTDESFILPQDTLTHSFATELTYSRGGWRAAAEVSWNQRDEWEFWGLPGNTEFDPEHEDYLLYEASLAKTWWLPKFTKLGAAIEYLGGEDLDRFSKYDFGPFGDAEVIGYQGGLVRAEEAWAAHLSYGIDLGSIVQVEMIGDAAWLTDELTGLDNEMIAGVGLEGTLMGPWETIMNFEVGVPVEGPGDGFTAFIAFLKLFG